MDKMQNKLWAIGGGKGGVGKSILTLMLGAWLARRGSKVILVDADLGGANLHTLLGIRYPSANLADFIVRKVEKLEDVALPTPIQNLRLICGADDILGLANPKHTQKTRLLSHMEKLEADIILLDLGAGTSFTTVDFFLYAGGKIIVLTPQMTSIQNAYGFIKTSFFRKLSRVFSSDPEATDLISRLVGQGEAGPIGSVAELKTAMASLGGERRELLDQCLSELRFDLIVNMASDPRERQVYQVISKVAQQYLDLSPGCLGHVDFDPLLDQSINRLPEFLSGGARSIAGVCLYDITSRIMRRSREQAMADRGPQLSEARQLCSQAFY